MKSLVKTQTGVGHLSLMDMPEPKPGTGEVLIEALRALKVILHP